MNETYLGQFLEIHDGSWVRTYVGDKQMLQNALWPTLAAKSGLAVRWVRGTVMADQDGLFLEFSAALQFPSYFGWNWDAFLDSLRELTWLPAGCAGCVLEIFDAELVLTEPHPADFRVLVEILGYIVRAMASETEWNFPDIRPPTPFHVVFHTATDAGLSLLKARLAEAGVTDIRPVDALEDGGEGE